MKILLIEDNPTDRKLFLELLQSAGHQVVQTDNADDALLLLQEQMVDLILVDVLLPGMDGLAFTRRLKADPATQAIPIVATSSVKEWPFERLARGAGCEAFIQKPVDTRNFSRQIAAIANQKPQPKPTPWYTRENPHC